MARHKFYSYIMFSRGKFHTAIEADWADVLDKIQGHHNEGLYCRSQEPPGTACMVLISIAKGHKTEEDAQLWINNKLDVWGSRYPLARMPGKQARTVDSSRSLPIKQNSATVEDVSSPVPTEQETKDTSSASDSPVLARHNRTMDEYLKPQDILLGSESSRVLQGSKCPTDNKSDSDVSLPELKDTWLASADRGVKHKQPSRTLKRGCDEQVELDIETLSPESVKQSKRRKLRSHK